MERTNAELSEEQQSELRDARLRAQLAVLRAIVREADDTGGDRSVLRLARALRMLNESGWFMFRPNDPDEPFLYAEDVQDQTGPD